ncbi:MAG: MBL fold metallo-hydrolase [Blastocatellia bacterium]|nr:MAG: MBL fold metallo-hydrolase [Blastocatellia bacterium]
MKNMLSIVCALGVLTSFDAAAQDGRTIIDAAAREMGTANLQSIGYSGTGSIFPLGQAATPGGPWPAFKVIKYDAAVNYDGPVMREEVVRIEFDGVPRGGGAGPYIPATGQGGIRPIPFGPQTQIQLRDARSEVGLLQIWMTPHGFLKAAANNTTNVRGTTARTVSFVALGKYTVTGTINGRNLVERVETRIDNTLLGDMLVETTYSDYRDYGGIKFPTRIVQRQGGQPTLDLTVSSVQPNGAATLQAPSNTQTTPPMPLKVEAKKIADGVWDLSGAALHSIAVEFADHLVVVEGPLNDEYAEAVIAEMKRVAPRKPIRYVVNTHHHSDHAGGIRGFAAEGIAIITHAVNKPYYEKIFKNAHQINPDRLARSNRPAIIEGVSEKRILTDGSRSLEIHHVRGNRHVDGLLMVYLPKEKQLIQADAFAPRPGGRPLPSPSPFTVNLYENVQRLKLDVAQLVHIHGGIDPYEALVKAAGRNGSLE